MPQPYRRAMLLRGLFGIAVGLAVLAAVPARAVEIEYWQYTFKQRVDAMDELIRSSRRPIPI